MIVLHRVEEELEESEGGRKCWERIGMWFCKLSFFFIYLLAFLYHILVYENDVIAIEK